MGCTNSHQHYCVEWGEAMIELSKILDRALVYTYPAGKLPEIDREYAYFRDFQVLNTGRILVKNGGGEKKKRRKYGKSDGVAV